MGWCGVCLEDLEAVESLHVPPERFCAIYSWEETPRKDSYFVWILGTVFFYEIILFFSNVFLISRPCTWAIYVDVSVGETRGMIYGVYAKS